MAKKKKIDIDKYASGLFARTEQYADKVRQHYATAVEELLKLAAGRDTGSSETFSFGSNKKLSAKANNVLRGLYSSVYNEIKGGVKAEWEYANLSCDALIESIFGKGLDEDSHFARWFSRNQDAMDAFFKRKSAYGGLNLSQKVWKYTGDLKSEMELALTLSLGKGDSAATVSRHVRQFLQNPDSMFRRFRVKVGEKEIYDEEGNVIDTQPVYGRRWKRKVTDPLTGAVTWENFNPRNYHPGQGVYRSSYKNAMRLTRTEVNMAYRTAEQDRWQRLDFVIGYEIKLSNNHPAPDICDDLKGKYPKDFVFKGWHPQCRCKCIPILAEEDEFAAMQQAMMDGKSAPRPKNTIRKPSEDFYNWIEANKERMETATTMPYWVQDNQDYINGKKKIRTKTEEEREAIRKRWAERAKKNQLIIKMANNVVKVAQYYPEIDLSKLQGYIDAKQLDMANTEARAIAKDVAAIKKDEKALSVLIPNVHEWKKQFTSEELHGVYDAVESRMAREHFSTMEDKKRWLETEIKWVEDHKKYSTWEVAQSAYKKELQRTETKIAVKKLAADTADALSFASITKSPSYKKLADEIHSLLSSPDVDLATVQSKADDLIKDYKVRYARHLKSEAAKRVKAHERRIAKRNDEGIMKRWDERRRAGYEKRVKAIAESGKLADAEKQALEEAIKKCKGSTFYATHQEKMAALDWIKNKCNEYEKKYHIGMAEATLETLDEMKARLGTSFPRTLEHLQEAIEKFKKDTFSYGGEAETYAAEIEAMMRQVFDAHDFGMNIADSLLETVLNTKFKNTFETGSSGGYCGGSRTTGKIPVSHKRLSCAHKLFAIGDNLRADQLPRAEYEKYGSLLNKDKLISHRDNGARQYGNVEVRFKKDKVNPTWTAGDSLGEQFQPSLTSDPKSVSFDHIFKRRSPDEFTTFDPKDLRTFKQNHISGYLELQYHGELTAECVESLTFPYDLTASKYLDVAKKWKAIGVRVFYIVNNVLYEL